MDPAFGVLTDVPASRLRRQAFLIAQRTFRAAYPGLYDGLVGRVRWGKGRDGASQIRERVLSRSQASTPSSARPSRRPSPSSKDKCKAWERPRRGSGRARAA